ERVGHLVGDLGREAGALAFEALLDVRGEVGGDLGEVPDEVEGGLDLVRDARGEGAEGGELLLGDELALRGAELLEGAGQLVVLHAELVRALGDAVLEGAAVLFEAAVEERVLDREDGLAGEEAEDLEAVRGEGAGGEVVLEVDDGEELALVEE